MLTLVDMQLSVRWTAMTFADFLPLVLLHLLVAASSKAIVLQFYFFDWSQVLPFFSRSASSSWLLPILFQQRPWPYLSLVGIMIQHKVFLPVVHYENIEFFTKYYIESITLKCVCFLFWIGCYNAFNVCFITFIIGCYFDVNHSRHKLSPTQNLNSN